MQTLPITTRVRTTIDPFDVSWRHGPVRQLAERARRGADREGLSNELFRMVWPWARAYADRVVTRLPSWADADGTRSEILMTVWKATAQIDWERWETWPALLSRRVRGARLDAARLDDALSRRDRVMLNRLRAEIADLEQEGGRTLTQAEREQVRRRFLDALPPRRRRAVAAAPAGVGVPLDKVAEVLADDRWQPERAALSRDEATGLRTWLEEDLPERLREQLLEWFAQESRSAVVPARLRARLAPYVPLLASRVLADSAGPARADNRGRCPGSTEGRPLIAPLPAALAS